MAGTRRAGEKKAGKLVAGACTSGGKATKSLEAISLCPEEGDRSRRTGRESRKKERHRRRRMHMNRAEACAE